MYFLYEGDEVVGVNAITRYRGKLPDGRAVLRAHYNEYMLWELIKLEKSLGTKVFESPAPTTTA